VIDKEGVHPNVMRRGVQDQNNVFVNYI